MLLLVAIRAARQINTICKRVGCLQRPAARGAQPRVRIKRRKTTRRKRGKLRGARELKSGPRRAGNPSAPAHATERGGRSLARATRPQERIPTPQFAASSTTPTAHTCVTSLLCGFSRIMLRCLPIDAHNVNSHTLKKFQLCNFVLCGLLG